MAYGKKMNSMKTPKKRNGTRGATSGGNAAERGGLKKAAKKIKKKMR